MIRKLATKEWQRRQEEADNWENNCWNLSCVHKDIESVCKYPPKASFSEYQYTATQVALGSECQENTTTRLVKAWYVCLFTRDFRTNESKGKDGWLSRRYYRLLCSGGKISQFVVWIWLDASNRADYKWILLKVPAGPKKYVLLCVYY